MKQIMITNVSLIFVVLLTQHYLLLSNAFSYTSNEINSDNGHKIVRSGMKQRITQQSLPIPIRISHIDLMNAVNDSKILSNIVNGTTIVLNRYNMTSPMEISFEAIPQIQSFGQIGSVLFELTSDNMSYSVLENLPPYLACGNSGPDVQLCPSLQIGQNTKLTATPYSGASMTGTKGIPYSIFFTIIQQQTPIGSILHLELMNAVTEKSLGKVVNNSIVHLGTYGLTSPDQFNFEAKVLPGLLPIGFVSFSIKGVSILERNEGLPPYLACGNDGNDISNCYTLQLGRYTISVTPYSFLGNSASRVMGEPYDITITFVNGTMPNPTIPGQYGQYNHNRTGAITGELKKWHKVTLGFDGPNTSETAATNPFTFYRLAVSFTHNATKNVTIVPGYYAADGNASNSGATSGMVWLVHFSPDRVGLYHWVASFTMGNYSAVLGNGVSANFFDRASGSFVVQPSNKVGRDHRAKGRLQYVGQHYLRFAETGEYFLKTGVDSPENFFAYEDFDNTPNNGNYRKSWSPHVIDYVSGNPTWAGGKGKGIIGALNYIANTGMNSFSFLTFNIQGDDRNVYMYRNSTDFTRFDVSKTGQWEIVLEHADELGLYLHFKMQEVENCRLLDNGDLGLNRRLYYRELIARFGHHLALNWNLGEEDINSAAQHKTWIDYIRAIDPYNSPIVLHTYPEAMDGKYTPLLGYPGLTGVSMQTSFVAEQTLEWVNKSAAAKLSWVVAVDESGGSQDGVKPDIADFTHNLNRQTQLYANIMNGGGGVEYYFGYAWPNNDLTCQDFRTRSNMWNQSRYALEFFKNNGIPFWQMSPNRALLSPMSKDNWCLSNKNFSNIIVYLSKGGTTSLKSVSLPVGTKWIIKWFDPLVGGSLQDGSLTSITAELNVFNASLGTPPTKPTQDWLVWLRTL